MEEYIFNADEVPPLSEAPAEMRVNIIMTQLLMTVEHLSTLKAEIDSAMAELMGTSHVHGPDCDHDHEEE